MMLRRNPIDAVDLLPAAGFLNRLDAIGNQHVRDDNAVAFDIAADQRTQRFIICRAVAASQDIARGVGFEEHRAALAFATASKWSLSHAAAQRVHGHWLAWES